MTILEKLIQVIHINPYLTLSLLYYYVLHLKNFSYCYRYVHCGISKKMFTSCPHIIVVGWREKVTTPTDIDGVIYVELQDVNLYPKLSKAVATYMIHGPCGVTRISSPCMINGRCSKFYPKKFKLLTTIDEDGYPCYKRQDNGTFILKNGIKLDNRNVVPYSPLLLLRYQAHVNIEYCNKTNSVKYLFKYV